MAILDTDPIVDELLSALEIPTKHLFKIRIDITVHKPVTIKTWYYPDYKEIEKMTKVVQLHNLKIET